MSTNPLGGGHHQQEQWGHHEEDMVVDEDDDIMFLDIISSASSSGGGSGQEEVAILDVEDVVRLEVRVRLMDRRVSMEISPAPTPGGEVDDLKDDDEDTPTDCVSVDPYPPVLDYPCSYPTCYWRFPSHARRLDHIVSFHLCDEEETAPMDWYQLDASVGRGFLSASGELDLVKEILQNVDGFNYMDI